MSTADSLDDRPEAASADSRRERKKQENRAQLLAAARAVFAEMGFGAASVRDIVRRTDLATAGYAEYFMLNCAHPTHFDSVLRRGGEWTARLRGVRANSSKRSHAELDASSDLDAGNPDELAAEYRALRDLLPNLVVYGGCCGTDLRHLRAISERTLALAS